MKFNKWYLWLGMVIVLLMLACAATQAQTATNAVPQLTADQAANLADLVNGILYVVPVAWQKAALSALAFLVILGKLGRAMKGYALNGWWGVFSNVFFGHCDVRPPGENQKGATGLTKNIGLWLVLLLLPVLCLTGCGTTPHQVANFSKGTGLNLNLPIGFNGANLAEINLKVGQFYTATAVQPVSTNAVYVPAIAFASTTDGAVTAPQLGGTNLATITGGDKFTGSVGPGTGSVSNLVGTTSSSGK